MPNKIPPEQLQEILKIAEPDGLDHVSHEWRDVAAAMRDVMEADGWTELPVVLGPGRMQAKKILRYMLSKL